MERIETTHPDGARQFAVVGEHGAASFVLPEAVIGLHHPVGSGDGRPSECQFLPAGVCQGDCSFSHGERLLERFRVAGEDVEVIYAELTDWYDSHFTHGS